MTLIISNHSGINLLTDRWATLSLVYIHCSGSLPSQSRSSSVAGLVGLYLVLEYILRSHLSTGWARGFSFLLTEGMVFKFDTQSKVAELYILMFFQHPMHLFISQHLHYKNCAPPLHRRAHKGHRCKITQKPVGIKKRKEFWCITITPLPSAVSNTISTSAPVSQVHASPALPTPLS